MEQKKRQSPSCISTQLTAASRTSEPEISSGLLSITLTAEVTICTIQKGLLDLPRQSQIGKGTPDAAFWLSAVRHPSKEGADWPYIGIGCFGLCPRQHGLVGRPSLVFERSVRDFMSRPKHP